MRENNVLFDLGIVLFDFLCYTLHEVKAMNQARRIFLENIPSECMFCGVSGLTQKWDEGDGWSFIGNPRPSHGLMLIVCHHAEIRVWDGGRLTARRGDMLYIPEGMEYDIHFYGSSGDITDVQVNFRMLEPGGVLCFGSEISCFLSDTPQQILKVMLRIADTSLQQKCPTLRVTKLFYGLLESVLAYQQFGDKQARKSGIAPALLYIDSHVGDRIRVSDLAKMSLMSESAFRKAFREQTGFSPSQYKIHSKIEKACALLATPDISISEISEIIGFCDVAKFYKCFVSIVGTTPRKYRDGLRK